MRVIKLAIISFILFFLLLTAISFLFPSSIRISKAVNIGAPRDSILELIKDTTRWKEWHPAFSNRDSFNGPDMLIDNIKLSDTLVIMHLSNKGKKALINGWQVYKHQGTDSLTLQWYIDFKMKWYPWQKFGSLFYEPTYGGMMEEGLGKIKVQAEKIYVEKNPIMEN